MRCGIKASAAKVCAKPVREWQGQCWCRLGGCRAELRLPQPKAVPNPLESKATGGSGGASANATGAVAVRNKGFRRQRLCQTHAGVAGPVTMLVVRLRCGVKDSAAKRLCQTRARARQRRGVVGPMLVPPGRLRCGIKTSAVKGYAKPIRGQGTKGSGSASAAGAVAVRKKGFRSQRLCQTHGNSKEGRGQC